MAMGSFIDELKLKSELPDIIFEAFLIIILLLAFILWVSFCVALYKAIKHFSLLRKQQRRQRMIENAIDRVISQRRQAASSRVFPITNRELQNSIFGELPSYDEAVHQIDIPPPPLLTQQQHGINKYTSTANLVGDLELLRALQDAGRLRIAPTRPRSITTINNASSIISNHSHHTMP